MNENINVSIAGVAFKLETDAYTLLKDYLVRIEMGYKNNPDGPEIISDIEARICELILNEQENTQPVPLELIQQILEQMGNPDDVSEPGPSGEEDTETERIARRLYRNPEGAKLGGVCSGIASYLNVEPVMVRLFFLIPLLLIPVTEAVNMSHLSRFFGSLFGMLFMLYFLLWFAIPRAKTPRQKLEMRGEKVTASSIQKSLESDFGHVPKEKKVRSASVLADLIYLLGQIALFIVKFVVGLIAFVLLVTAFSCGIGTFLLLTFLISGGKVAVSNMSFIHVPFFPENLILAILILILFVLLVGGIGYILLRFLLNKTFPAKTLSVVSGIWLLVLVFTVIGVARHWEDYDKNWMRGDRKYEKRLSNSEGWIKTADSVRVEEIRIGDSTYLDTIRIEYFDVK